MCGRYSLEVSYDLFAGRYGIEVESTEYESSSEIFPTNISPLILYPNELVLGKWGFKLPYSSKSLINARIETITEKKTFKEPFKESRCLIPATSFFEWEKVNDEKIKRKVTVDNQFIFSMAGIIKQEEDQLVYSILTMDSNEDFKKVHHRMPVILQAKDELIYLNKNTSQQDVLRLCQQSNPRLVVR